MARLRGQHRPEAERWLWVRAEPTLSSFGAERARGDTGRQYWPGNTSA